MDVQRRDPGTPVEYSWCEALAVNLSGRDTERDLPRIDWVFGEDS